MFLVEVWYLRKNALLPLWSWCKNTLLPPCGVHVHVHNTKINGKAWHSHTHTHTRALLPLFPEFWPTGLRPLAFTHFRSGGWRGTHTASHTNKIKRRADRWREGKFKEVHSEMLESLGDSSGGVGGWGIRRAARAFTLGEAWRACSLRRTSRRCCRTLCLSAELLEPCSRGCPWGKHTSAPWEIHKLITSSTVTESQEKVNQGQSGLEDKLDLCWQSLSGLRKEMN